ncbi:hypothetical protein ACIBQ1_09475 [Nonomuraea sp. NPDC050153]|uniref:DUF6197 family protein n=1 Tax=Nonomuraea sp. NPDC050153 TaxID=3364359 RepID=UPI003798142C
MNAETILHAAIGVLQQRGRCTGDFLKSDGRVCQLGALAVAAGQPADLWRFLRDLDFEDLIPEDRVLVEAARILAKVEAPLQPVHEMSIERLVSLLGDCNDLASDTQVFTFLARAANVASIRARWRSAWRGAARLAEASA